MSAVARFENLKDLIVELRGQSVLFDSDVAELYKVGTKRVNEAVKNNPNKFPNDYMFEISEGEFADLRSKFSTTKFAKTRALPKAFTEKGLYMIATILKSKQATEATFAIIETFQKSDSYQGAFKSYRLFKINLTRRLSCRKVEKSLLNSWMTICKQPTLKHL